MRAVLCFQSPFLSLTRQQIKPASASDVEKLLEGNTLFAFAPVASHANRLKSLASTLGFPSVEFTGPLEPKKEETLVIYPLESSRFEIARV
jgi:hypothetical protein